jgi:methyl coenzyme M reductase gamma subunit
MTQEDLLSTLRNLEPGHDFDHDHPLLKELRANRNVLEDVLAKQGVTNELLLELIGLAKGMASSDFASQARPIKNKPFPRPIRRLNGSRSY